MRLSTAMAAISLLMGTPLAGASAAFQGPPPGAKGPETVEASDAVGLHGSLGGRHLDSVVAPVAGTQSVVGYWLVAADQPAPAQAPPPPMTQAASGPSGTAMGIFLVTCYDLAGRTASGAETSTETVAVDPSVIPLGSWISIGGLGTRVAQDTGGAIQGDRLDIWEPTYAECESWGVQSREVWMVSRG